jgi:signal transduction histidine kinase
MIRANIYSRDHTLIWSSTKELSGEHFEENDELDEALRGEPIIGISVIGEHEKEEHVFTDFQGKTFVEYYIPIKISGEAGVQVIGIIEFYRLPTALLEKIKTGERIVWMGTLVGGVFLFVMLFWIIRRAARIMAEQEEQLIDSEKFAAIGTMASVVAHGLRNPLSAIRSSAELGIEINPDDEVRECLVNVVDQADRLEKWIGEYLVYARLDSEMGGTSHVDKVIKTCLAGFQSDMDRQQISNEVSIEAGLPRVCINELLLTQVLHSLVSNALEAMTRGGQLGISAAREARQIVIKVTDIGCGMPEDLLAKVFKPFQTTKRNGLGVGLPLVEQIVKGHGGKIVITSKPQAGTQVTLWLPMEEPVHEA